MSSENYIERLKCAQKSVMFLVYNKNDQKFIIEERIRPDSTYKGQYIVPAGHIETNETTNEALIREIDEEQGITPTEYYFLDEFHNVALNGELYIANAFLVFSYRGTITNKEPEKCILHSMSFGEANEKMTMAHNKYVLFLAKRFIETKPLEG